VKSSALIIVIAALGVAIAWSPMAIGSRSLHVQPFPSADLGLDLPASVITPSEIQDRGMATLSGMNDLLAAGSLLVSVCALVVFFFSRASDRAKEILVHRAVGASRRRLVIAGVCESGLLAIAAAILGSALGLAILQYARASWPGTFDSRGLLVPVWLPAVVGVTIVLGILVPLKSLGRMRPAVAPLGPLLAPGVCVAQLAICFAVMVGARQVGQQAKAVAGVGQENADEGSVFQLEIPASPQERSQQLADLITRSHVAGLFDVASLSSPGALDGLGTVSVAITECGACSQGGIATPLRPVSVSLSIVSADTFRALNTQLLEGRWISDKDDWKAKRVAVITRGLARAHFENGHAIGRRIQMGQGKNNLFTVVGVVDDRTVQGLGGTLQPAHSVYASVLQVPPTAVDFLLRPRRGIDWSRLWTWLPQRIVKQVLPEQQWRAVRTASIRWFGTALMFSGGSVVLLALLGITLSMSIWVGGMLPELAVRRCVGARRRDVLLHVGYRSASVAAVGVVLGILLAELTAGPLSSIVGEIQAFDAAGILQIALMTVVVTALGSALPAWRACRLEPVVVLSKHAD
jgi:ABC-type antimicrobial peptide transport system permease subunit